MNSFRRSCQYTSFCLFAMLIMALLIMAVPVQALPVADLYSYEIAVENQSDAERQRAYREALAAVMLKVTGDLGWLQEPAIQRALSSAQNYVQEVSFRTGVRQQPPPVDPVGGDALAERPLVSVPATFITVRFSRELIEDVLDSANIPIWDQNRPSLLVWLTIQDASGRRTLLGSDSEHQIMEIMQAFSRQRGIPVLIPVLDLTDRRTLSADQAWNLDEEALRTASARYGADSVLGGRLLVTPNGDLVGLWRFLFKDQVETFDGFDRELTRYIQLALDRVTSSLASHYGIVRNTLQSNDSVLLRVDGIRDIASHQSLVSYLRNLSVVRNVSILGLSAESLELNVTLSGTRQHLADFIDLDRDLRAVEHPPEEPVDFLHYRWVN